MLTALTRAVSSSLPDCELTFLARQNIDVAKAIEQQGKIAGLLILDANPLDDIRLKKQVEYGELCKVATAYGVRALRDRFGSHFDTLAMMGRMSTASLIPEVYGIRR